MTSVQSWLLLPSSWREDQRSHPTPLHQGGDQSLFQPPDHRATSLPARGEPALSQVVCPSHLHGFLQLCHLLPMCWGLVQERPAFSPEHVTHEQQELPPGADSLCSRKHGAPLSLSRPKRHSLLFFSFSRLRNDFWKSDSKITFSCVGKVRNSKATETGVLTPFAKWILDVVTSSSPQPSIWGVKF